MSYRLHIKYEYALKCFQQVLSRSQELKTLNKEANALYKIARTHQYWGKYEEAIAEHQLSRDLFEQLSRENKVKIYYMSNISMFRS
ncbi:MAG: tetratricopeptide repeat protein [Rhizonema sp. PD38]|nr:tetratricopeptide repeat protein [Rhizonema sp. PD38]